MAGELVKRYLTTREFIFRTWGVRMGESYRGAVQTLRLSAHEGVPEPAGCAFATEERSVVFRVNTVDGMDGMDEMDVGGDVVTQVSGFQIREEASGIANT